MATLYLNVSLLSNWCISDEVKLGLSQFLRTNSLTRLSISSSRKTTGLTSAVATVGRVAKWGRNYPPERGYRSVRLLQFLPQFTTEGLLTAIPAADQQGQLSTESPFYCSGICLSSHQWWLNQDLSSTPSLPF